MEIKLIAASDADAERAETAALNEIKRLNGILSGYDASSEFRRWAATRGEAVHVSPELMEVLNLWDSWRARTGGALNPAAEIVGQVWKKAEAAGRMPTEADMAAAAGAASQAQWRLAQSTGLATRLTATPIMLNSFTKSWVIERAAGAALRATGVSGVVLNIGGDMVIRGAGSDSISVVDPRSDAENSDPLTVLKVSDRAIATSGNYRRGYEIGGQHYSHIVDPRTGHTAEEIIGATVVARDAVDAGALATAFCVLTPEESRKLAATVPGTEFMLMKQNGEQVVSAGWKSMQAPRPQMIAAAVPPPQAKPAADGGQWNPGYELTIDVELPRTQGFGGKRPYVALWIEDKDRYPIRTLAVLFEKPKYLNELRAWYRDDRLRSMSEGGNVLNSVTSATRAPGKYTFKWDGKDNSGKFVKPGKYTVLVEAAREHGGYSLDHKEMDFTGQPEQAQLPPDKELGAVSFDYHKAH
jgi:thiamine biosynthesis lipoprotein ApbE